MKITTKNGRSINLSQNNLVTADGGEGIIYKDSNDAIKIYKDQANITPEGKILELSILKHPNIIAPTETVKDSNSKYCGYIMPFVNDRIPFCKLFPRGFIKDNKLTPEKILNLILDSRKTTDFIHKKDILIVDLNEMNLLITSTLDKVLFIDVDSYQTKNYPAKVIMENIRDYTTSNFSENSDWYSWGILTYQVFMGIHPYGGNYKGELDIVKRMKQGTSVYNQDVIYPKIYKNKSLMPQIFDDWYKAIFLDKKRCPPPESATASVKIAEVKTVISHADLKVTELCCLKDNIIDIRDIGLGQINLVTSDNIYNIQGNNIGLNKTEKNSFVYKGTRYRKIENTIQKEVKIGSIVAEKLASNCMPLSTIMFNGIAVQSALGSYIFTIFPTEKTSYNIIKKLEGYRILDAKFDSYTIILAAIKNGKNYKIIFSLNDKYQISSERIVETKYSSTVSFAVTDKRIVAHILDDEQLELFSEGNPAGIKLIKNQIVSSDMTLYASTYKILFTRGNKLYRLETK